MANQETEYFQLMLQEIDGLEVASLTWKVMNLTSSNHITVPDSCSLSDVKKEQVCLCVFRSCYAVERREIFSKRPLWLYFDA